MLTQILLRAYSQINSPEMQTYLWLGLILLAVSVLFDLAVSRFPEHSALFRLIFCFTVTLYLALFCGLRHIKIGTDTERYSIVFSEDHNITPAKIIESFTPSGGYSETDRVPRDATFFLLSDMLQFAGFSPNGILCFYALFYVGVVGFLIYRYSINPALAFFAFMAFGTYVFDFTGVRQAIAIAITGLSFPFIEKKKFLYFVFVILVAMLFHKSAITFFPAWFLCRSKITLKKVVLLSVMVYILYTQYSVISRYLYLSFGDLDRRMAYFARLSFTRSVSTLLLRVLILFVFLIARGKRPYTLQETIFLNLYLISVLLETCAIAGGDILARVGYYYSFFSIFILPLAVESVCAYVPKYRPFIYGTVYAFCAVYFAKVISIYGSYHFFWEGWQVIGA